VPSHCRMKILTVILFLVSFQLGFAQSGSLTVGFEQDALPYIFNGYFANVWVGKGHVRSRVLMVSVRKPDFLLSDGFTNNRVHAYAITADYFLKEDWKGWWISTGGVLWKNSLQTDLKQQTARFNTYLLNGSLGYSWKFYKNFYVSPWTGLHLRVGCDKSVSIDGKNYKPPFLNPEASIKVGWHF
jgi:hypothetical protein